MLKLEIQNNESHYVCNWILLDNGDWECIIDVDFSTAYADTKEMLRVTRLVHESA